MFPSLGMSEMLIVMLFAVILFGKRLPEVGRSLGKGIAEFKKGLRGFEAELEPSHYTPPDRYDDHRSSDLVETSVPKFEPPSSAPVAQTIEEPQPYQD
jgi:sec-independent protein translocase protein TatA